MTTAQGWVLISALMTTLAIVATLTVAMVGSLRSVMNARFDAVDARFDGVDKRLDLLDRDVQNVIGRMFRDG